MKTLTEFELQQVAGSGDLVYPVSNIPPATYSPPAPVLPASTPGNVSPRHVDN